MAHSKDRGRDGKKKRKKKDKTKQEAEKRLLHPRAHISVEQERQ